MQEWAQLTPDERRAARERYQASRNFRRSSARKCSEKWQEYQQSRNARRRRRPRRRSRPHRRLRSRRRGALMRAAAAPLARRLASLFYEALLLAAVLWLAALAVLRARAELARRRTCGRLYQAYLVARRGRLFRRGSGCAADRRSPMKTWRLQARAARRRRAHAAQAHRCATSPRSSGSAAFGAGLSLGVLRPRTPVPARPLAGTPRSSAPWKRRAAVRCVSGVSCHHIIESASVEEEQRRRDRRERRGPVVEQAERARTAGSSCRTRCRA